MVLVSVHFVADIRISRGASNLPDPGKKGHKYRMIEELGQLKEMATVRRAMVLFCERMVAEECPEHSRA